MKKVNLLCAVAFGSIFAVSANFSFAANPSPSKNDTAEFILNKIKEDPWLHHHDYVGPFKARKDYTFSKDKCTLFSRTPSQSNVVYEIPIASLLVNVTASSDRTFYMELQCAGGGNCFKGSQNDDASPNGRLQFDTHSLSFKTTNETTLKKMESAFLNLRSHCTGKKELF